MKKIKWIVLIVIAIALIKRFVEEWPAPSLWTRFVETSGQYEPIPEQWLQTEEARIAHNLVLPDSVPKPKQFSFMKARWSAWLPWKQSISIQYFEHLCETEAGQWILKTIPNVSGLYFARPEGEYPSGFFEDRYQPEMPWIQRALRLTGTELRWHGALLVDPPFVNYQYVEEPQWGAVWQKDMRTPYVRIYGLKRVPDSGTYGSQPKWYRDSEPMQAIAAPSITAKYGYTWRGIRRPRDREHRIAGGEVIIYDVNTREVVAIKRQFLIGWENRRGEGDVLWEIAASCPTSRADFGSAEFQYFAVDVLNTSVPSPIGARRRP